MQEQKKMNLIQLTFIVAVNMMGSGIIMLPTNMAQVGAISLLSWVVTAVGSMAIAYGFAQAGIFNQRTGGMAAYAEDAYGKDGYFQVFILYFLSLAIGNVAIGISAVGYLATFFPGMNATPIATCMSVIALLWLTTVANFGGPSLTGKIGSVTVWGVIIPVGAISLIGWFWFSSDTFAAAWNPKGLSLGEGMGSSISLTLWAFLGMESAAQNSSAVEDPKKNVPLACLFGTLGAAVIYVLSTTVIQGIVPNAELAASTGPFGLAYEHMFNPTIGRIIMALAVLACLGSLLGWQFTIAQTGKSAAEDRMFPQLFTKVNRMGAPVIGMIVLGVVQTGLALMTISPTLSEQFSALVNLAVVTNVLPYIVSLSALVVMMRAAKVADGVFKRNVFILVIALAYSVFALYASGKDAVMGGMLVVGIAYSIWGFLAPRFSSSASAGAAAGGARAAKAVAMMAVFFGAAFSAQPSSAGTLDRVKETGHIKLGYLADGAPFTKRSDSGAVDGFGAALCQVIAEQVKTQLALPDLTLDWVPVTGDNALREIRAGNVDLLCTPVSAALTRRQDVAFSIAVFPGGVRAVLRADTAAALRQALAEHPDIRPVWRGSPASKVLGQKTFAAVEGSTAQKWLTSQLATLQIDAKTTFVADYGAGLQQLRDGKIDALFGDRTYVLGAMDSKTSQDFVIGDRLFTHEAYALALGRNEDDFRLVVDRSLSQLYPTNGFRELYKKWIGEFDNATQTFFLWSTPPQ
ncbi:MAG TPA: putrescine-ornithine antiporter [Steroidobacteraceae bacterium]|nr:putrescine-ornithine antiporter [Steroidobacteraceae bacterium]